MPTLPDSLPVSLSDLSRLLQQFADTTYPGNLGIELRIRLPGRESPVVIPGYGVPPAQQLSDREQDIVQALEEAGPEARLTGEALGRLAGYTYDAEFRRVLSRLVKGGHLVNHRPGYSLPA